MRERERERIGTGCDKEEEVNWRDLRERKVKQMRVTRARVTRDHRRVSIFDDDGGNCGGFNVDIGGDGWRVGHWITQSVRCLLCATD